MTPPAIHSRFSVPQSISSQCNSKCKANRLSSLLSTLRFLSCKILRTSSKTAYGRFSCRDSLQLVIIKRRATAGCLLELNFVTLLFARRIDLLSITITDCALQELAIKESVSNFQKFLFLYNEGKSLQRNEVNCLSAPPFLTDSAKMYKSK